MADDNGVMCSVAADYELDVGNLVVFHGRGPPASSAMTDGLAFAESSPLQQNSKRLCSSCQGDDAILVRECPSIRGGEGCTMSGAGKGTGTCTCTHTFQHAIYS